jgi:hypothetical protein
MDEAFKMAAIESLTETGEKVPEKTTESVENSSERYGISSRNIEIVSYEIL